MTEAFIEHGSFKFGLVDMYETYGIRIIENITDYVFPKLRERKVEIPARSGKYDFGAEFYDERQIILKCASMTLLERSQIRELSYTLSRKNHIVLCDEPELYYVGQIYEEPEIVPIRFNGNEFVLKFTCEPFAYGETIQEDFSGVLTPEYHGTARTPTRIEIENTGSVPAVGIQITLVERKGSY